MGKRQIPTTQQPQVSPMARSVILLFTLSLFAFSVLFFLSSLFYSSTQTPFPNPTLPSSRPETSFLASVEHFLASKPSPIRDDTSDAATEEDVHRLDADIFGRESQRLSGDPHYPMDFPIRVYVYEMPKKFTYDLLWLFWNTYRDTDNLTSNGSPVHRLIEQHSVDYWLWADLIAPESERLLNSVIRVQRQEDADLFYIPFFTTISFFLMEKQQCKALYRVKP